MAKRKMKEVDLEPCYRCESAADIKLIKKPFDDMFPYKYRCGICGFVCDSGSMTEGVARSVWNRYAIDKYKEAEDNGR